MYRGCAAQTHVHESLLSRFNSDSTRLAQNRRRADGDEGETSHIRAQFNASISVQCNNNPTGVVFGFATTETEKSMSVFFILRCSLRLRHLLRPRTSVMTVGEGPSEACGCGCACDVRVCADVRWVGRRDPMLPPSFHWIYPIRTDGASCSVFVLRFIHLSALLGAGVQMTSNGSLTPF
ncbi:hypothetical protein BDW22DRAFT_1358902 [Trametopsis cervina]|nr:hypothetical protein BDW22DRAFT_1358902 [Trametopsis cervina]